ncbi:MAG: NUDIX domain-containing protein [Patescibacteria group bacterium]
MKTKRFKITPAVYLVLIKDNKVLLLRRYNTGHEDGNYSFVAGHFDGNETIMQAMVREAREEADINIKEEDLEIAHVIHRFAEYNDVSSGERIDFFIKAEKWQGEPKNMEPEKCDDLDWFDLDNLPENTIAYIKQAIDSINKKIFYSEFGWEKS